jgi:hypothetical protein
MVFVAGHEVEFLSITVYRRTPADPGCHQKDAERSEALVFPRLLEGPIGPGTRRGGLPLDPDKHRAPVEERQAPNKRFRIGSS